MKLPRRIAIATCSELADLVEEDRILAKHLAKRKIEAVPSVWSDPKVAWVDFDAVLVRSVWDYHQRFPEFLDWLDRLDEADCKVFNPTSLLSWNAHKRYLLEVREREIPIVPTVVVPKGKNSKLADLVRREGWKRWVTKPAVSASAAETYAWSLEQLSEAEAHWQSQVAKQDMLVQSWIDVDQLGEWSLVFLDGSYSHAVLKRPAPGDFRVQQEFGGRHELAEPSEFAQDIAGELVMWLDDPTYARVDGYQVGEEEFWVSEVELIEPALFLQDAPGAFDRFAKAIEDCLKRED